MKRLKQKILTIYAFLIFLICAVLFAIPLAMFYSLVWHNNEQRRLQFHKFIWHFFCFCSSHIPGTDIRIKNESGEDFEKPALLICNHQSHLDLLCTLMLSPRIVAMTNKWVWKFPLYAPIIKYLEYYPTINGVENSEEAIDSLLRRGYSVLIFPEGTRSATGEILRFHKGAFYLAQKLEADIVPIFLDGTGKVLPKTDFTLHPGSITVEVGQRVKGGDTTMGDSYQKQASSWRAKYQEHAKGNNHW